MGKIVQSSVTLNETRIFIIFVFRDTLKNFERALSKPVPVSEDWALRSDDQKHFEAQSPWRIKPFYSDPDLHPALTSVFLQKEIDGSEKRPVYWELKPEALVALNKRPQMQGRPAEEDINSTDRLTGNTGLGFLLGKAAKERLGLSKTKNIARPIKIESINFFLSQTRLGQMAIELSCPQINLQFAEVNEILYALCRNSGAPDISNSLIKLDILSRVPKGDNPHHIINLGALAKHLLPDIGADSHVQTSHSFSYVMAQTDTNLDSESKRHISDRLARRLTRDYKCSGESPATHYAESFDTITHACAIEGGSLLVSSPDNVEFLENFSKSAGQNIYWPMALIAHKEFHDLIALVQGSSINIEHEDSTQAEILQDKIKTLVKMQERVLNFRLSHHNSVASFSENHNLVQAAWRKAMHIERMMEDLSEDVSEATTYLQSLQDQLRTQAEVKARNSLKNWTSIVSGVAGLIAGVQVTPSLLGLIEKLFGWPSPEMQATAELAKAFGRQIEITTPPACWSLVEAFGPVAVGMICAPLAYRLTKKKS